MHSESSAGAGLDPNPTIDPIQLGHRRRRRNRILFASFITGAIIAFLVVYFGASIGLPGIIAGFAAAVGLAAGSPLAAALALVLVAVVGALFAVELAALWQLRKMTVDEAANLRFLRILIAFSAITAGTGLGVFLAASTPAVLGVATSLVGTGVGAFALVAAAGLVVSGLLALVLYAAFSHRSSPKKSAPVTPIALAATQAASQADLSTPSPKPLQAAAPVSEPILAATATRITSAAPEPDTRAASISERRWGVTITEITEDGQELSVDSGPAVQETKQREDDATVFTPVLSSSHAPSAAAAGRARKDSQDEKALTPAEPRARPTTPTQDG